MDGNLFYITILWENDPRTRLNMLPIANVKDAMDQVFHMRDQGHGVEVVLIVDGVLACNHYFSPR